MIHNLLDASSGILSPVGYIEFSDAVKKDERPSIGGVSVCGPLHCDFKPWQRLQQVWFAWDCPFSVF